MRWLKHIISLVLVVVAAGMALSIGLSDHSDEYGRVSLPQGGVLQLPKGKVTVFFGEVGKQSSDPIQQASVPLEMQAVPVGGGTPVPITAMNGQAAGVAVTRSETIGELGAVAQFDVPAAGAYQVTGNTQLPPGAAYLKLGTNAKTALLDKWKLFAGLLGAALLIALIPVPRHGRVWEDERGPAGWSSDSRSPYAG